METLKMLHFQNKVSGTKELVTALYITDEDAEVLESELNKDMAYIYNSNASNKSRVDTLCTYLISRNIPLPNALRFPSHRVNVNFTDYKFTISKNISIPIMRMDDIKNKRRI